MMLTSHNWVNSYDFCFRITCGCCFSCILWIAGINFLFEDFAANVQLNFVFHNDGSNLVDEMINRNVSMITTSHDFVLMKNGTEIASPMNCIITPNDRFTWRMMKYAVTTRNDPMTLPTVSIFIKFSEHKDNLLPNLHSQITIHVVQSIEDRNEHLLQVICMMLLCILHHSSYQ